MFRKFVSLIMVSMLLVLSACASASQRHAQSGGLMYTWGEADEEFKRPTPVFPKRPCTIEEYKATTFPYVDEQKHPWYMRWMWWLDPPAQTFHACPLTDWESKEKRWAPIDLVITASTFDVIVPPLIHGAMFLGGMGLLGSQINAGLSDQPPAQGALAGSSISTLNMRGTGPAFAGMQPAPLGGVSFGNRF